MSIHRSPRSSKRQLSYRSAREFFSSLQWEYTESERSTPVFTHAQIKNEPLKWLKYLLLAYVGLTTERKLKEDISRFGISDIEHAQRLCHELLESVDADRHSMMVVLKVMLFNKAGQLPNYRIYTLDQVLPAFRSVWEHYRDRAQEVWLCKSYVAECGTNLGGRITLHAGMDFIPSQMEIVWYTSPRKIEEYQVSNFPYPYLRAHKFPGSLQFMVDTLHIPARYTGDPQARSKFLKECQWVLTSMHYHRESIDELSAILSGAGAKEISIEFKASGGRFSIIDWDTEIETRL